MHALGADKPVPELALQDDRVPYVALGAVVGGRHAGIPQEGEQVWRRVCQRGAKVVARVCRGDL